MKTYKIHPNNTIIEQFIRVDYADSFGIACSTCNITIEQAVQEIFGYSPCWMRFLMHLRGVLVKPLGLTHQNQSTEQEKYTTLTVNGKVEFFTIIAIDASHIVLSIKDSHLDAVCCLFLNRCGNNTEISLTSAVEFHNRLGKCYFAFIKPFHKAIIRATLRNASRKM